MLLYIWPGPHGRPVEYLITDVTYHFRYRGFDWLPTWPEPWMTVHFVVLGLAGLLLALGLYYRLAAVSLFLTFTYVFLLEEATYLNHFYLMSLISFLLIFLPAQRCLSIDAWRKSRREPHDATTGPAHVPFWSVLLLRAQMFIVYFYSGLAKIEWDWLSGAPMRGPAQRILDGLGQYFAALPDLVSLNQTCLFLAWSGLVFDLSVGFLLINRRTRYLGLLLAFIFHLTNHFVFPIGVFPAMAFTATLIFLDADWPRQCWSWLRHPPRTLQHVRWSTLPRGILALLRGSPRMPRRHIAAAHSVRCPTWTAVLVAGWLVAQLVIPLRHYAIDGDANWTEEGHRFSWRMMLKQKRGARLQYDIDDPALFDDRGATSVRINWHNWPASVAKAIFVEVDASQFDWSGAPEILVLYEPLVGERIVYNPHAQSASRFDTARARQKRIEALWQRTFGRCPKIHPTVDLADALGGFRHQLQSALDDAPVAATNRRVAVQLVDQLLEIAATTAHRSLEDDQREDRLMMLQSRLQEIGDTGWAAVLRGQLRHSHPFSLQGAAGDDMPFLVIEDAALTGDDCWRQLEKLWEDSAVLVWFDPVRLSHRAWRGLPEALMCFQHGHLHAVWNFHRELEYFQTQALVMHPEMMHRYAGRIADRWKTLTGRRAGVHLTNFASLNYRPSQMLVDPTVDIARAKYRILGHNRWIFQLDEQLLRRDDQDLAFFPHSSPYELRLYEPGKVENRSQVKHYPSGRKQEEIVWDRERRSHTVTRWHMTGEMALQAAYLDDRLHGSQTKWRPDGTIEVQMQYRNGQLHGQATIWHENGQVAQRGEFEDGKQVQPWKSWSADEVAKENGEQDATINR